jgi:hypothetical protein
VAPNLPSAPPGRIRFSFEPGQLVWGPYWGEDDLTETLTTEHAYDGTHALRVQVAPGRWAAVGTVHIDELHPGSVVTLHVWYEGQGEGKVCAFAQNTAQGIDWIQQSYLVLDAHDLPAWHTYSWTMPNIQVLGIGVQLTNTSTRPFVVLLDAVSW